MVTANGEAGTSTDDWRYNRDCIPGLLADQPNLVFEFTGTSSFMEPLDLNPKVKLEVTEELARPLPKPTSQAQKARAPPTPKEPTWQERELHELTHLPFRSWCPLCVETESKDDHHTTQADKQPVIQLDYCFITEQTTGFKLTLLVLIDVLSGLCGAAVVVSKGPIDYAINFAIQFVLEAGRTYGIIQSDNENPIK